jgi:hypothetical protein
MEIWANQEWPVGMATREREANCEVKKQRERAAEVGRAGQGSERSVGRAHRRDLVGAPATQAVRPQIFIYLLFQRKVAPIIQATKKLEV